MSKAARDIEAARRAYVAALNTADERDARIELEAVVDRVKREEAGIRASMELDAIGGSYIDPE